MFLVKMVLEEARDYIRKGYNTVPFATLDKHDNEVPYNSDDAAKWNYFSATVRAYFVNRDSRILACPFKDIILIVEELYSTMDKHWSEFTQEETIQVFDAAIKFVEEAEDLYAAIDYIKYVRRTT